MLVLKQFDINKDEDIFLKIAGRGEGILNGILSLLGLAQITSLQAGKDSITFETSSTKGKENTHIPMSAVTAVTVGYTKKLIYIVLAVMFFLGGIYANSIIFRTSSSNEGIIFLVLGLIFAAIFLLFYKLSKTMFFAVYAGGLKKDIEFTKGVNIEKVEEAAILLSETVLSSRKK